MKGNEYYAKGGNERASLNQIKENDENRVMFVHGQSQAALGSQIKLKGKLKL